MLLKGPFQQYPRSKALSCDLPITASTMLGGESVYRCSPRTQAYSIILVTTINVIFVVNSVPWLIISAIPSWQRSNDSTEKPLRTLRYDGVLTSHTNGVFPLLTDNEIDLADRFDAEAYVKKTYQPDLFGDRF